MGGLILTGTCRSESYLRPHLKLRGSHQRLLQSVRRVQQFSDLHLALWRSVLRFFLLLNRHFDDSAHCTDLLPYHREFVFSLHTVSQADMFSAHEIDFCDRAAAPGAGRPLT